MIQRSAVVFVASIARIVRRCAKDDSTPINQPPLNASATAVAVTSGQTRNVTMSGGTPAYSISSGPNTALAPTRLDSAKTATPTFVVVGAVTTATGSTPVVVRDNSSPPKQASITITKQ